MVVNVAFVWVASAHAQPFLGSTAITGIRIGTMLRSSDRARSSRLPFHDSDSLSNLDNAVRRYILQRLHESARPPDLN
jgi:hypothetical protein